MKKSNVIENGCGGKKGTKCYVEEYILPYSQVKVQTGKRKTDKTLSQKSAG
jgi:hypothetical protein